MKENLNLFEFCLNLRENNFSIVAMNEYNVDGKWFLCCVIKKDDSSECYKEEGNHWEVLKKLNAKL